jgi:purine-nucleoside phosphorylase
MSPAATDQLAAAARHVRGLGPQPQVGVVLGSGLGAFADSLIDAVRVGYDAVPHMPPVKVEGHAGNLVLGRLGDVSVACLQGRVHAYEGHELGSVVFGVRLLATLGCRAVLLTNAAGGINRHLAAGDLMLITDHLNLMGRNPLVGPPLPGGARFPDLTAAYDPELRAAAHRAADSLGVRLADGVYAAMLGPSYETPAEIRMLERLGADAVGMSTVPEVIALRERGVRVGALSCITNLAAGIGARPLAHAEVEQTAAGVRPRFVSLLAAWVGTAAGVIAE